jgi:hypothetical protein
MPGVQAARRGFPRDSAVRRAHGVVGSMRISKTGDRILTDRDRASTCLVMPGLDPGIHCAEAPGLEN